MKTEPRIPSSEKTFLDLKGNFTESVRLTFVGRDESWLNGWYVFERTPKGNKFVRKTAKSSLIDVVTCDTVYLRFDRYKGVLPDSFYYNYKPIGPKSREEYETLRERLSAVEKWREVNPSPS